MKSWQLGSPQSPIYKAYDYLRNYLNIDLANYLYSFVKDQESIKVLEPGSGPGFCTSQIAKKKNVDQAIVLDIDKEVINIAKKRDPKITARVGDIFKLPFPNNSFDLVYNSSTLEHFSNSKDAFKEMVRVCKKNGYIFVGIPTQYGPLGLSLFFPEQGAVREWVGRFLPRGNVIKWGRKLNVSVIQERYYFFRFFKGYIWKKN